MANSKWVESLVGIFIMMAVASMLALSFKVSDFNRLDKKNSYEVRAEFDNIGGLKPRAAVTIAGVKIGQVDRISLDPTTYKASVYLRIRNQNQNVPVDSTASIVTAGLLGANYVSIAPGFDSAMLQNNAVITDTHPALILEDMIGQLLFSMKGSDEDKAKAS
ncbi:MAG: outer membrane lipid asymmetry maintenance protein MlaD [Gammaproteobacteria bacterium]|nr:outer membrane lipid asymmetry maintenance protein MlaD [Gammaproteobacteria bacterium]